MKCLWFFLVLICIASCRHYPWDVAEEQEESLGYPLNQEFDQKYLDEFDQKFLDEFDKKFLNERWQDLDTKDSDPSPELSEHRFWNFPSDADINFESENNNENPEYDYNYVFGEEIDRNDPPALFWPEDDDLFLFKESPFLNSEGEKSDKSSEEYINNDWLYNFDYIQSILKKQKEEDTINDKYVNMDKFQLPDLKIVEENNNKILGEKAIKDIFPLRNENDQIFGKFNEEEEDVESLNIENKLLPYFQFDQEDKKMTEEKENGDWLQFPSVNDFDYSGKMIQENEDEETLNNDVHFKITLLRDTENKITLRIVSIDDNGRVVGSPEMEDTKNGLEWDSFSDGKYFDNYNMNNDDPDDRFLARRYINRSRMFMTSIVIVVFSITLFGFCLLCKIFNPKKKANKLCNKDSGYQPLNEEIA